MRSLLGGLTRDVAKAARGISNQVPVPYSTRNLNMPVLPTVSPEAQMRTMGSVGTLFAIVNRTSNATAQVNWKLWRSAKSGLPEERVEVTSHLALDLWNKPNEFMTRQEFVEAFQQHLDLAGEAWWVVGRNPALRSIPLELWPVAPHRMAPVPDKDEFISRYEYTGPMGERVPLGRDEVVFLRMPNPLDPYRGMGPVQSILTDLDSTRYSAEWNRNFFINSAEPGGIVQVDRRLSDDEFDEMRDRWHEQHRGVANAHRVAILEQATWVDRAFSQRDMQFVELRNVSREVIREAFGFPKSMLGTSDDVNRAVAEAQEVVFARWLLVPRLERIKGALNNDFLPLFGPASKGLEFDYENPVPEDLAAESAEMTAKANAAKTFIDTGFDPVDVLELLGLPDMAFKEKAPPPPPVIAAPPPAPGKAEPADEPPAGPEGEPQEGDGDPPTNRVPRALPVAKNDDVDNVDLRTLQAAWERALEALLSHWGGVIDGQITELLEQIREAIDTNDLTRLAYLQVSSDEGAQLLAAALHAFAETSADHVVKEAKAQGVDIDPAVPNGHGLVGHAKAVAALLGAALAVSAGVEALRVYKAGANGQDVAAMVRGHLESLTDSEPRRALGAALTGAQNEARFATLKAAPVAALYASEQMDKNTCEPCRKVHGRWLGNSDGVDFTEIEKTYPNGGYVGCLGRSRCRGTVVGVWRSKQTGDGQ